MNSIVFVDTVYSQVLNKVNGNSYRERRNRLLDLKFGTSDFYSEAFRSYGWQAEDIIANDESGLRLYMAENNYLYCDIQDSVKRKLLDLMPIDVLYIQDLSFFSTHDINYLRNNGIKLIIAQLGCSWPGDDKIKNYDIVFTSLPHYLQKINDVGVEGLFLQIGFGGHTILEKLAISQMCESGRALRDIDISFVGGIGPYKGGGHWTRGTAILSAVAEKYPNQFKWFGYGLQYATEALRQTYGGEKWGLEMYEIYSRSKIVINRHGEIAQNYSNNMRLFESTGVGALLMTENSLNIKDYFEPGKECVTYENEQDLLDKIDYYLNHEDERKAIAKAGQKRTLECYTYEKLLKPVVDFLEMKLIGK